MTVQEYVDRLMSLTQPGYKNLKAPARTCDGLLCGDPNREVRKVASTFLVTVDVIRAAMAQNVDLILSHEPLMCVPLPDARFHMELTAWDEEKRALLEQSGIAVMRFHDGMHFFRPDLIYRGWMMEFGWEKYNVPGPNYHFYIIPETTLAETAAQVKKALGMQGIRTFGDPAQKVSRVGVLVGGGSQGLGNPMMPMQFIVDEQLDLLICGEIMELSLPYFAADAAALGHPVSLLVAGHNRTEEVGMKHLPSWLIRQFPEIEAVFLEAGDPIGLIL